MLPHGVRVLRIQRRDRCPVPSTFHLTVVFSARGRAMPFVSTPERHPCVLDITQLVNPIIHHQISNVVVKYIVEQNVMVVVALMFCLIKCTSVFQVGFVDGLVVGSFSRAFVVYLCLWYITKIVAVLRDR